MAIERLGLLSLGAQGLVWPHRASIVGADSLTREDLVWGIRWAILGLLTCISVPSRLHCLVFSTFSGFQPPIYFLYQVLDCFLKLQGCD